MKNEARLAVALVLTLSLTGQFALAGGPSNPANPEGEVATIVVPPTVGGGTGAGTGGIGAALTSLGALTGADPGVVAASVQNLTNAIETGGDVETALGGSNGTGGVIAAVFGGGSVDIDAPAGADPVAVHSQLVAAIGRLRVMLGLSPSSPSIATLMAIAQTVLN